MPQTVSDLGELAPRVARWLGRAGFGDGRCVGWRLLSGGTQNANLAIGLSDRRVVARLVPSGGLKSAEREARVLAALGSTRVPHPAFLAFDRGEEIGHPVLVMDLVDGVLPSTSRPVGPEEAAASTLVASLVQTLSAISEVPVEDGLSWLRRGNDWIDSQVTRWTVQAASYGGPGYAGLDSTAMAAIDAWLSTNRPATWTPGLLHGDFHAGNALVDRRTWQITAIVDWELASIGDPLLDLAHLLCTWPSTGVDAAPLAGWVGLPEPDDVARSWSDATGRDLEALQWFRVLAAYRLAVLVEGSNSRAARGDADPVIGARLHLLATQLIDQALNTAEES